MYYQQIKQRNSAFSRQFTEFGIFCAIYYLLYGSEIFSDFLFIQEVTVLLKKSKKSLMNAVKLNLKCLL